VTHLSDADLHALVDGELAEGERRRVLEHTDVCDTCRRLLAQLGRMHSVTPAAAGDGEDHDLPLVSGVKVGRYVVTGLVGAGAMSHVFAAHDPELDRDVAIKVLRPGARVDEARLQREAQALARLSHPNVVAVHDIGTVGGRLYVAMELVRGVTLSEWLRAKPRAPREVLAVYVAAGRGLVAAHALDIVHRDFKPDNVLVGDDGRVRVADFGLAAMSDAAVAVDPAEAAEATVTRTGALLGTPAYMAPEVLRGAPATPASDQLSFAVALYEGLHGHRPFSADTLGDLARTIERGPPPRPARSRVPRWIDAAVRRGLAARPGDRYPSMQTFLDALERDPAPRRRDAAVGLGALALLGAGLVFGRASEAPRDPCAAGPAELATAWGPGVRQTVHDVLASASPDEARIFAEVIDRHAGEWVAAYRDACEATQVRHEQSEALLDRRMECLARDREELGALVALFAQPAPGAAAQAVKAAYELRPVARCAVSAVSASRVAPVPPEQAERVAEVRTVLAKARSLLDAGRYQSALAVSASAREAARAVGYAPLDGEAEYLLGDALARTQQTATAVQVLDDAFRRSITAGDESTALDALARRTFQVGVTLRDLELGQRLLADARVLATRLEARRMQANLDNFDGIFHAMQGDSDGAVPLFERSAREMEALLGPDHPLLAGPIGNLGRAERQRGHSQRAREVLEQALAIQERALGPDHPELFPNLANLAQLVAEELDDLEEGVRLLERAAKLLPPGSPQAATERVDIAGMRAELGEYAPALAMVQQAVAALDAAYGEAHLDSSWARVALGAILSDLGRHDEAIATLERALATRTKLAVGELQTLFAQTVFAQALVDAGQVDRALQVVDHLRDQAAPLPPEHPAHAAAQSALCHVLSVARRPDARAACQMALTLREARHPATHAVVLDALLGIGEGELAAGQPAAALPYLERAHAGFTAKRGELLLKRQSSFALARALTALGGDRHRARALVEEARRAHQAIGSADAKPLEELDAWLAAHP
jgi:tetratricopeptide (TPR) repeat protein